MKPPKCKLCPSKARTHIATQAKYCLRHAYDKKTAGRQRKWAYMPVMDKNGIITAKLVEQLPQELKWKNRKKL